MKSLRYVLVVLFVVVIGREIPHAQHVHGIPDFCQGSADTVRSGQTMVLSGKVIKGCIRVEANGTLILRSNTSVIADMIFGLPGSRLEGGTPQAPLDNVQIIGRNGSLNRSSDPEEYGRGLVWFGSVRLHGLPKTPFARVTQEPRAGQGQIFAPTTGWRPGDRLLLPGTHQPAPEGPEFKPQVETPQVIVASNDVVTIQPALAFDHLGAREMDGTLRFLPHVGNLTRSIRIRSENPAGTRWHVIFVDRADVDIRYVSFVNLGRTTTDAALRIEPRRAVSAPHPSRVRSAESAAERSAVHAHRQRDRERLEVGHHRPQLALRAHPGQRRLQHGRRGHHDGRRLGDRQHLRAQLRRGADRAWRRRQRSAARPRKLRALVPRAPQHRPQQRRRQYVVERDRLRELLGRVGRRAARP